MVHRPLFALVFAASSVASLAGCAMDADAPGEEDGFILLDRQAKEALFIEVDGFEGAPKLPLAVAAGETIHLKTKGGEARSIQSEPGKLAYIHDVDDVNGQVEWLAVGRDARSDRLVVHASEASARELALLLGATAAPRGDGLWNLTTPDIFTKTSYMDAPEGLLEALPDAAINTGDIDLDAAPGSALLGPSSSLGSGADADALDSAPGRREALFVGLYTSASSALRLDASGRFSLRDRCSGEAKEGFYYADDGRIVLQSRGGSPISLAIDIDKQTLVPPSGDRLRTLDPWWVLDGDEAQGQGGEP